MLSLPKLYLKIFVNFIYLWLIFGQNILPDNLFRDVSHFNSKIYAKSARKYSDCQQFTPGSKSAILCQGVRQLNTLELLNKRQKKIKTKGCKDVQKLKRLEEVVTEGIHQKLNTIYETLLDIERKISCKIQCPSGDGNQLTQTTFNPTVPYLTTDFSLTTKGNIFSSLITEKVSTVDAIRTEFSSTFAQFLETSDYFLTTPDSQVIEKSKEGSINQGISAYPDFTSTGNREILGENQFLTTTTAFFSTSDSKNDTTLLETTSYLPETTDDISKMEGIIVYYPLDVDFRDYGPRHWDAHVINDVIITDSQSGVAEGAKNKFARFSGNGYLKIKEFKNFHWGHKFGASVWFRRTGLFEDYATLISNGYAEQASWDIRLGREQNGERLGAGIITPNKRITWDYTSSFASTDQWHHVVLTYDGNRLDFYLDNVAQSGNSFCCFGDIVSRPYEIVIGTAGFGGNGEYFAGDMDEIVLFNRTLSQLDVKNLFDHGKRKIEN